MCISQVCHSIRLLTLFLTFIVFAGTGCKFSEVEMRAIDTGLGENPHSNEEPSDLDVDDTSGRQCVTETYDQPDYIVTKKIDIVFVTDTSGSLNQERGEIAQGIEAFVRELPSDADYNIGVVLAHGSLSKYSGRMYSVSGEPRVLKSSELSHDEIRTSLVKKMYYVRSESASDGGEEGLFSLSQALQGDRLLENQRLGMFRKDAALAVVFVADENAICARYPQDRKRVHDPNHNEGPAFDRDCANVTPESVVHQLKELKGNSPLLVSGIIYNEQSRNYRYGENEIGWGYVEAIQYGNGLSIDLSGNRFHEGLSNIGSLATRKLNLKTEFALTYDQVDIPSIKVFIDGTRVNFNYVPTTNEVHLKDQAGGPKSEVLLEYCQRQEKADEVDSNQGDGKSDDPSSGSDSDSESGTDSDSGSDTNTDGGSEPDGDGPAPGDFLKNPVDEDGDGLDDRYGFPIY